MFSPILLSLAMAGTSAPVEQIIIIDDRPSIRIPLRDYDLGRSEDLRKLRFEIGRASRKVCDHGYRDTIYLVTLECVDGAMSGANGQLNTLLASRRGSGTLSAAALVVTAPSN